MSAEGRGAHTYPDPHALDWSPVLLETLQVITSCIPFMPFCRHTDTHVRGCSQHSADSDEVLKGPLAGTAYVASMTSLNTPHALP